MPKPRKHSIVTEAIISAAGFDITDRESCLAAIRKNAYYIRYIHNPDKEVQLEAVRQYGESILYIHNPDKEVQMEAIKSSDYDIDVIVLCPDWKDFEEEIENYVVCKEIIE
jgi:DNA-binding Lrp family transcriptional regulator